MPSLDHLQRGGWASVEHRETDFPALRRRAIGAARTAVPTSEGWARVEDAAAHALLVAFSEAAAEAPESVPVIGPRGLKRSARAGRKLDGYWPRHERVSFRMLRWHALDWVAANPAPGTARNTLGGDWSDDLADLAADVAPWQRQTFPEARRMAGDLAGVLGYSEGSAPWTFMVAALTDENADAMAENLGVTTQAVWHHLSRGRRALAGDGSYRITGAPMLRRNGAWTPDPSGVGYVVSDLGALLLPDSGTVGYRRKRAAILGHEARATERTNPAQWRTVRNVEPSPGWMARPTSRGARVDPAIRKESEKLRAAAIGTGPAPVGQARPSRPVVGYDLVQARKRHDVAPLLSTWNPAEHRPGIGTGGYPARFMVRDPDSGQVRRDGPAGRLMSRADVARQVAAIIARKDS